MKGLVIKSTGNWLIVENKEKALIDCRVRGNLRLKESNSTNPIAVGDQVEYDLVDDGTGIITAIHERTNYIVRKSVNLSKQVHILAANVDHVYMIITPAFPKTSTGFIDRIIAAAASYHINISLIFNKSDLFVDELSEIVDDYISIYKPLGYNCIKISALSGEGIEELKSLLKNKINLLIGHSGVGKSSIINAIDNDLKIKTSAISKQHLKGKHTTTFAEMHRLNNGGYIIDTPGVREFVNIDFKAQEISHYFIEMLPMINQCKFNNCLHENENGCAVKLAVEEGKIHPMRYYNYLSILHNEDLYK